MPGLSLFKAQPTISTEPVASLTIYINQEVSTDGKTLDEMSAIYRGQGSELATALLNHLPGATVDQLLVCLLKHKASLYRVPHGTGRGGSCSCDACEQGRVT